MKAKLKAVEVRALKAADPALEKEQVRITLRLPWTVHEHLQRVAALNGLSMNTVIIHAIVEHFTGGKSCP